MSLESQSAASSLILPLSTMMRISRPAWMAKVFCTPLKPDAISAARPGARREILETYVKRLEKLETMTEGMKGVEKTFAIQAGRELRIVVEANRVTDDEALWLSRDVAKKIEAELQYPGQIKVTVIRETRAVEYAR